MGKRVSIYLPDDVLLSIQETAKKDGRSVSNYLVQLHKATVRGNMGFIDEAGSISEKTYKNIETGNKIVFNPDKFKSHKPVTHDIKKKVKKIIEEVPGVQSASNVFNPQPKGKE